MNKNHPLEIERKFLIKEIPENLNNYPHSHIEQGYLCRNPVLRIRHCDSEYILTYKAHGMMIREEHEHPLTSEAYSHLLAKTDGIIISKTRYRIPDSSGLTIELDVFEGSLKGFTMAEVEFPSEEAANTYFVPEWFSAEVTSDSAFHNSNISKMSGSECAAFLERARLLACV